MSKRERECEIRCRGKKGKGKSNVGPVGYYKDLGFSIRRFLMRTT